MSSSEKTINQRNSSIELLRIISMIMIVIFHFATHGGFRYDITTLSAPLLWWNFLETGGKLGVDIFVLISGYFLVDKNSKIFNFTRIAKFWGQVVFYSVAIYLIFCFTGLSEFGIKASIKTLFPITFNAWWFASTYFVLYLLHPFINMLLQKLNKNTYQALIAMQVIFWCIIPTFTPSTYQGNNLLWFITLYTIAGYIKLFGLNPRFKRKHYIGFFFLFSAIRYLSSITFTLLATKIPVFAHHSLSFYSQESVLTLLCALSLFMIFVNLDIGYIKTINIVASTTFGVYLIHDSDFIRPFLWLEVFKNAQYQDSLFIVPYSISVTVVVYVICTIIDLLRQYIFEKPFLKLLNRYSEKIILPFEKVYNFVKSLVFGK